MSRQFWGETIAWQTTDGTAIANTVTETILFPNVTIPGNYMNDGRVLRIRAFGRYSTTATPTMQLGIRWGGVSGTLLWQTEAMTMGGTVTALNWELEALLQTRSNGSTGTIFAMGTVQFNTSTTAVVAQVVSVSGVDLPAAVTVDLTADTALSITAKWGTANASNTIQGHVYTIESMN